MQNSKPSFNELPAKFRLSLALQAKAYRQSTNRLAHYRPYQKQLEFHAHGLTKRERLFMAGNQLGKTWAGAFEYAMHMTGKYPDWWNGRRWARPIAGWAAGVTGESTRDTVQKLLLGRPGQWGTGAIPKTDIIDVRRAMGVADLVDSIRVRHVSVGESIVSLKAYEKGREKWQGETLDLIWFDEEPSLEIYSEGLTRTNATGGMVFITFTPLLGQSAVVKRFRAEMSEDRAITTMTIDEALHYSAEQRAKIIAGYPEHEREARAMGVPMLGSGRVFPVTEESIKCQAFLVPKDWPRIGGLDFGWDHPTAAVRLVHNRDEDIIYLTGAYRRSKATPLEHAAALLPWGETLRWAWPHDGLQHDKGSGLQLADQYRKTGMEFLHEKATFEDGTYGLEAGIQIMLTRMQTGRFKVFAHLQDWWEEFRQYHRKDGLVVKEGDDLMSATRVALMMLRFATIATPRSAIPATAGSAAAGDLRAAY